MPQLNAHPHPVLHGDDEDLADLYPRLTADDGVVRRLALIELAELEEDAHAPWLAWALTDVDAGVRTEAAARLAYWEQPGTVQALAHALADDNEEVRRTAAVSLGEIKLPESGLLLLPFLASPDAFVRAGVLRALRELRLADSFAYALAAADAHEPEVRLEAVGVLGWLKRPEALPVLTRRAGHDDNADVRRAAAGALGLANEDSGAAPQEVLAALKGALLDAVWQVREEAATTLGKLKLAGSLDALVAALQDDYWQVRQKSARALGRLGDSRAVKPLVVDALTHSSANLRKEAAIALGEIGDASAVPALQVAAEDLDPDVRKLARLALTKLMS